MQFFTSVFDLCSKNFLCHMPVRINVKAMLRSSWEQNGYLLAPVAMNGIMGAQPDAFNILWNVDAGKAPGKRLFFHMWVMQNTRSKQTAVS